MRRGSAGAARPARPSAGPTRRVQADRPPPPAFTSLAALAARETGRGRRRPPLAGAAFARLELRLDLDAASPPSPPATPPHWARKRSRIVEVALAPGLVLALTAAGGARAFDRATGRALAHLNASPGHVVRSLYVNRARGDVVTVSVSAADSFASLRCAAVPLAAVRAARAGGPLPATPLFPGQALRWPGFVEFDDVNGVALTHDAGRGAFCVFGLATYAPRFSFPSAPVREVRTAPGVLLLVGPSPGAGGGGGAGCRLVSVADGAPLAAFSAPAAPGTVVDYIEMCGGTLLVGTRPAGGGAAALTLVDVATGTATTAPSPPSPPPTAFIFLHEARRFLAFGGGSTGGGAGVWCAARGARVAALDGVALSPPAAAGGAAANSVYVTADQQYVVCYCRGGGEGGAQASAAGPAAPTTPGASPARAACGGAGSRPSPSPPPASNGGAAVTVSHVATGACVARLSPPPHSRASAALAAVTALVYDEDAGDMVTGGEDGRVALWAVGGR